MISNPLGREEKKERCWFEYFIGDLLDTSTLNQVNNIIVGAVVYVVIYPSPISVSSLQSCQYILKSGILLTQAT